MNEIARKLMEMGVSPNCAKKAMAEAEALIDEGNVKSVDKAVNLIRQSRSRFFDGHDWSEALASSRGFPSDEPKAVAVADDKVPDKAKVPDEVDKKPKVSVPKKETDAKQPPQADETGKKQDEAQNNGG